MMGFFPVQSQDHMVNMEKSQAEKPAFATSSIARSSPTSFAMDAISVEVFIWIDSFSFSYSATRSK